MYCLAPLEARFSTKAKVNDLKRSCISRENVCRERTKEGNDCGILCLQEPLTKDNLYLS